MYNEEHMIKSNTHCPFCGSDKIKVESKTSGQIKRKNGVRLTTWVGSVRCNKCHSRGPTVSAEFNSMKITEMEEAKHTIEYKAFELWNKRA